MDLNAHGGEIALLKLARDVALDEGCLSDTAIANEDDFEGGDVLGGGRHCVWRGAVGPTGGGEEGRRE